MHALRLGPLAHAAPVCLFFLSLESQLRFLSDFKHQPMAVAMGMDGRVGGSVGGAAQALPPSFTLTLCFALRLRVVIG